MGEAVTPREAVQPEGIGGGQIPVDLKMFLQEDLKIGVNVALGKKKPREILEDAIKNREWFKGIVLSAAFFEYFGSRILEGYTKGGIKTKKLNLRLHHILRLLFDFGMVDQKIYSKMNAVKEERNRLAHEPFERIDEKKVEKLIRDAIDCLEFLGVAD